jgi:hypothetical protein
MFNSQQIHEVLELHQRSFALLRWVRASLKNGQVSFSVVHKATDSAAAANEWIGRHLGNLPADARPRAEQIPMFSRLFVSFLTTSYRLNPRAVRLVSECGCRCSYCAYLQAGPNLEPRVPSKKDTKTAVELKRIYLSGIAAELCISDAREAVGTLLDTKELSEGIAMATWGAELLRRSEFTSQGEAVLALWREFSRTDGSPRRRFEISASQIMEAERKIVAAMKSVTELD